jgi:hypothetical protein
MKPEYQLIFFVHFFDVVKDRHWNQVYARVASQAPHVRASTRKEALS